MIDRLAPGPHDAAQPGWSVAPDASDVPGVALVRPAALRELVAALRELVAALRELVAALRELVAALRALRRWRLRHSHPSWGPLAMSGLEANKELVRRLYERLMANGDVAAAEAILDDRYIDHSLPGNAEGGRAELIGLVQAVRAAIPDVAPVVDEAVAEGDLVAVRITARGRHTGAPFPPGIPATGRAIEWREQHIFRVADGRIVGRRGVFDNLGILQQLGAVPMPG